MDIKFQLEEYQDRVDYLEAEITKLRKQLAVLTESNENWMSGFTAIANKEQDLKDEIRKLREQLALRDLEIVKLHKVLDEDAYEMVSEGWNIWHDKVEKFLYTPFTITHLQELIKGHITSALEKAYECNVSNGYHNSWDMDLIIDAVIKEFKA